MYAGDEVADTAAQGFRHLINGLRSHVDDLILDVDDQTHGLGIASDDHMRRRLFGAALILTKAASSIDRGNDLAAQVDKAHDTVVGKGDGSELGIVEDLLHPLDLDADEESAHPEGAVKARHHRDRRASASAMSASTSTSSVTRSSSTRRIAAGR